MSEYSIRPAVASDAEDYVHCQVELTNTSYLHLMPASFARRRRAEVPERIDEFRDHLVEAAEAEKHGREPFRRHWVALNERAGIVGVVCAGPGVEGWEYEVHGRDLVSPVPAFSLSHLYIAPATQGSGLGQRLLDTALPGGRGAYLWIIAANHRAAAFYRRNGFSPDGFTGNTGPTWGNVDYYRMTRPDPEPRSTP